jgi:hypothetical protein
MNPFVVIISNYLLLVYFVDSEMEEVIAAMLQSEANKPTASAMATAITDLAGAMMDGETAFAILSNVVMSPHVANMAHVAMTSVIVTTAGPVMIAMTKLSTL